MKMKLFALFVFCNLYTLLAQGYDIGDKAMNFKLKNVDNQYVSLADYKSSKGVLLVFTCNHCPFSVANEDRIIALDKKFKNLGVPVVAINPNNADLVEEDSFENMQKRAHEKGFTFPYLQDAKQEVFPKYGAQKTPHVFLLENKSSHFEVVYMGAIDNSSRNPNKVTKTYAADAIVALLNNKPIEVKTTKAIGCSIKM